MTSSGPTATTTTKVRFSGLVNVQQIVPPDSDVLEQQGGSSEDYRMGGRGSSQSTGVSVRAGHASVSTGRHSPTYVDQQSSHFSLSDDGGFMMSTASPAP